MSDHALLELKSYVIVAIEAAEAGDWKKAADHLSDALDRAERAERDGRLRPASDGAPA